LRRRLLGGKRSEKEINQARAVFINLYSRASRYRLRWRRESSSTKDQRGRRLGSGRSPVAMMESLMVMASEASEAVSADRQRRERALHSPLQFLPSNPSRSSSCSSSPSVASAPVRGCALVALSAWLRTLFFSDEVGIHGPGRFRR
jgi:hypothetical protein